MKIIKLLIVKLVLLFLLQGIYAQNKVSNATFQKKLDAYMTALLNVGEFSGNVLVFSKGKTLFHRGYGFASKRFNIMNDTTTKFRIASMTKSFTAICILKLMEQGKLSVEDNISNYINFPLGEKIKIKHLLSHTSGIKRDLTFPDENKKYSLDELVSMTHTDSLLFAPGSAVSYSNCDYILLQAIIEKIAKTDFESFLTEQVLLPLGLHNTGIEHPLNPPKSLADGYGPGIDNVGHFQVHETKMLSFGYPEAVTAMYSTTGDMLRFCRELGKGKILRAETWKLAFTPVVQENPFSNWGLGFTILGNQKEMVLNHNGRTTGFKGGWYYDINADLILIILGNNSEAARSSIVNTVQAIMDGKDYYTPEYYNRIELDAKEYHQFVGEYAAKDFTFTILEHKGKLFVKSHGDAPSSISPYKTDAYFNDYFDLKLLFKRNGGIISECEWIFQGKKSQAKKIK